MDLNIIARELINVFKRAFEVDTLESVQIYVDEAMFRNGRTGWFAYESDRAIAYDIKERLSQKDAYRVLELIQTFDYADINSISLGD